ncbi:polyketide cyclase [Roseomonas sp. M0104]|uniref:Polyketide cyclase n=1 Tax=Teichococcus coralli TaxID=2545983 RepID=A0A845B6Y6_9PROT|nr:polyketide cyclase [Pseudoroseomonas coralli]MXP61866.1 polyketide cyclase [Pseudoroseomonas coralli]
MLEARTISIAIARNWRAVYEAIWRPEDFRRWASGLSQAGLRREGDTWRAEGPEGPVRIRFTPRNDFGVMDHFVDTATGPEIAVPLRVVANGEGAEVMLTLFRQPGMSAEKFAEDAAWMERDLAALRALLEGG